MKNNFKTCIWVFTALAALVAGSVSAQDGIVSIESVSHQLNGDTVMAGENLRFVIRFNNNTGARIDVSNGYRFSSPDGATWDSTTIESIGPINDGGTPGDPSDDFSTYFVNRFNVASSFGEFSCDGVGADTVSYLGAGADSPTSRKLPATWNDTVYAITAWFSNMTAHNKRICVDTSFFQPGGTWVWVTAGTLLNKYPAFQGLAGQAYNQADGGYCFRIWDPAQGVDDGSQPNLPKEFALGQNYPNPFNPTTNVKYDVPRRSSVKLTVYNVLGQRVKTLVDEVKNPGSYSIGWDGSTDGGSSVSSGIYFYKMEAGSFVQTKKMVLMK
jgi:hypothetical protein